MRNLRIVLWLAVAVIGGIFVYGQLTKQNGGSLVEQARIKIGGPFDLITQTGEQITEKDLQGRPHAIFFGFTHCPEICPTSLFEISGWLKELGDDADKMNVYFFSVDPERDTPEILANYMSSFDKRIMSVTGEPAKMQAAIKAYRAYSKKVELDDGDYTMDHTATIYLMRGDSSFAGTIDFRETSETAIAKLKRLIKNG